MATPYELYAAALYVIDEVGQGRTLTSACDMANLSLVSFKRHVASDASLQELLDEAVQRGNDALIDALIDVDTHALYGHLDSKMAKVQSDNIKWVLSKRDPGKFGDKIEIKHEISVDRAITDALAAARNRVALPPPGAVEDALILSEILDLKDVTPS
jgi:hypothetical protein